jgi:hypothetical protein
MCPCPRGGHLIQQALDLVAVASPTTRTVMGRSTCRRRRMAMPQCPSVDGGGAAARHATCRWRRSPIGRRLLVVVAASLVASSLLLHVASPAQPSSLWRHDRIQAQVVTSLARSPPRPRRPRLALLVVDGADRLEVGRVAAPAPPAKVVEVQPLRHRPALGLVHDPVRVPGPGAAPDQAVAVLAGAVLPQPAAIDVVDLHRPA